VALPKMFESRYFPLATNWSPLVVRSTRAADQ
jgi:hypothetical protein